MDERRNEFLLTLPQIMPMVNLNDQLIEQLRTHPCRALVPTLNSLTTDDQKVLFILTVFNWTDGQCQELIECLRVDGQIEAAKHLERYNQPIQPSDQDLNAIELTIQETIDPKSGGSKYFSMENNPRGLFILFVNVSSLCQTEGPRFEHLFKQLYFVVKRYDCLSRQDMMTKLEEVAKNEYKGEALFVMYVGHGQDEMLVPSMHDDGPSIQMQSSMAKPILNNKIDIKTLVDMFAKNKCHQTFDIIPKVFIFNCCRTRTDSPDNTVDQISGDPYWKDNTTFTFICQSCAEGYGAFYNPNGFTQFGQAFSQTLAYFSHVSSLNKIFIKVCDKVSAGDHAMQPQVTMHNVNRALYLNPGYVKH